MLMLELMYVRHWSSGAMGAGEKPSYLVLADKTQCVREERAVSRALLLCTLHDLLVVDYLRTELLGDHRKSC